MAHSIALFGTSSDPPTRGHQCLLEGLVQRFNAVVIWASDNPMKHHSAPLAVRSALLQALVDDMADRRVSLLQDLSSPWAVSTVHRAAHRWPEHELIFVIGSDLVPQIPQWKQVDAFLARCRLAVAPRQGWPLQPSELETLQRLGATIEVLDLAIPASASSELRQAPQEDQIPAAVWPLLLKHNLYGLATSRR